MNKYDKYETVVGLEVHVQLQTATKAFCADDASFGGEPNTHISPISLGHPGTLPRLNESQVRRAVKLGLALDCAINKVNFFDRKNYFYADSPKGYQITQDNQPICIGGGLDIHVNNVDKHIRLHHIHMEEDAGKSIHENGVAYSLIDLNRAGVPLLEIVTEPDMRSAEDATTFITELRKLVRYLDISDGNMEEGSIRCDCNISVRLKGAEEYGNRCEIKNVNSIRNAKRAINHEVKRQIDLLENGGSIQQQTRAFDAIKGTTYMLRSKENAPDYRYFPEPDLPPVVLTEAEILEIQQEMPILPKALQLQFITKYKLSKYDATILTEDRGVANYFLDIIQHTKNHKSAANWLINSIKAYLNETNLEIENFSVSPIQIAELIQLIDDNKVNQLAAKQQLFPALIKTPNQKPLALAKKLNLIQDGDTNVITELLEQTIAKYPNKFASLKKGKKKLMGLFMGEVMRGAKGKANPKDISALIRERLKK